MVVHSNLTVLPSQTTYNPGVNSFSLFIHFVSQEIFIEYLLNARPGIILCI